MFPIVELLPVLATEPRANVQRKNLRPKSLQSRHCWAQVPLSLLIHWEVDIAVQITLKIFFSGQTDRHAHTYTCARVHVCTRTLYPVFAEAS